MVDPKDYVYDDSLDEFIDDVNLLADKLKTVDDFNMCYKDIKTEILDEDNDIAQFRLANETIAVYVYSGFQFSPIYVNPGLLKESLDIMSTIVVDI